MYVAHWISGPYLSGLAVLKCCCCSSWPPVSCCRTEARGNTTGSPPVLRSRSPPSVAARVQIKLKVTFLSLTLCSLLKTWSIRGGKRRRTGGRESFFSVLSVWQPVREADGRNFYFWAGGSLRKALR